MYIVMTSSEGHHAYVESLSHESAFYTITLLILYKDSIK